jgi:hypothetical protein
MIRHIIIVILSLALLASVYGGVYRFVTADAEMAMAADRPELEWLRREYSLNDQQFEEIQARHEKHDVLCRELCRELVESQKKLNAAIVASPEMGGEVQAALAEWTAQRERCREAALRHMYDISVVMEPEQASEYRQRIYRKLIVPGRMPHIGEDGEFHDRLIEHAAPREAEAVDPSTNE